MLQQIGSNTYELLRRITESKIHLQKIINKNDLVLLNHIVSNSKLSYKNTGDLCEIIRKMQTQNNELMSEVHKQNNELMKQTQKYAFNLEEKLVQRNDENTIHIIEQSNNNTAMWLLAQGMILNNNNNNNQ